MSQSASRGEDDLSGEDRARLEVARQELAAAVAAYQRFIGGALVPGEPMLVVNAGELGDAQGAVELAEANLWQLREQLLGWSRPSWAPNAALIADWFSEEDAIYDEVAETTSS